MTQGNPEQEQWRQPLTGPTEDTGRSMPVIGPSPGAPAQDTPNWQPPPLPVQGQSGQVPATSNAHLPVAGSGQGVETSSLNGLFSSVKRTGRWEVPAVLNINHGMSEVKIDFREAIVTSPVVEVHVYSFMSDTKIIVPPGVGVEFTDGASILSEEKGTYEGQSAPGGYKVKVKHYGMMSVVNVLTLAPGESQPKWWKRGS